MISARGVSAHVRSSIITFLQTGGGGPSHYAGRRNNGSRKGNRRRTGCDCPVTASGRTRSRLQLSVLAYNLGNLWRRLVLPTQIDSWSVTSLQQRLVKTGGRLVQARPVLLAAAGRESSDPTPVRGDAAADLGAAGPGRLTGRRRTPAGDKPSAGRGVREMRWNRAVSSRFQAGTGHGSGFQGAGWSAVRKSVAAGSRGCNIREFGEGKSEIPGIRVLIQTADLEIPAWSFVLSQRSRCLWHLSRRRLPTLPNMSADSIAKSSVFTNPGTSLCVGTRSEAWHIFV